MRRASHQLLDDPKVFDHPLALRVLGPKAIAELQSDSREDSHTSRALRAFLVARSRFAEDELAAAVERGIRQSVILGAGLDTSAFRAPHADRGLRILEVDQPATQASKPGALGGGRNLGSRDPDFCSGGLRAAGLGGRPVACRVSVPGYVFLLARSYSLPFPRGL